MSDLDETMNDKKYETPHGVKCALDQLVKIEPGWAANRIREGEKAIARIVELKAHLALAGILANEIDSYLKSPVQEATVISLNKALQNYNSSIFKAASKSNESSPEGQ